MVKRQVVLTRIRNSPIMARPITYNQFFQIPVASFVDLLLKYRDYQSAILLAEQLDERKLLSSIYESWCVTFLKQTKEPE
jgi:hypothetical protein